MRTTKTVAQSKRSGLLAGIATLLVLGAIGYTGHTYARDDISFSVGIGVPGLTVGVSSNAYPVYSQPVHGQPVYPQPVYVQPRPVYIQPQPIYVQPRPVYVQPAPVYVQPAPVYHTRPRAHGHHNGGYYVQAPRPGHGPAYRPGFSAQRYAPIYYQR